MAGGGILIWKLASRGGTATVDPPVHTVHVTTTGDDAKDGLTAPVKTLKRAIATSNGAIATIALAAGKFGPANGETFPYTVPTNVTIQGDPAGGTILVGTAAGDGMTLDTGKLADLELDDFQTAVKATGTAALSNVKVRTSAVAVSVETAAKLTVDKLDIAGTAGACTSVGLLVRGSGQLTATGLAAHTVGTVLSLLDQSSVSIANGNMVGDPACATKPVLEVRATSLALTDVMIDGGGTGIAFLGSATTATLTNTTIANTGIDAIFGSVKTGQITGGELRNNGRAAIETDAGAWTLTNVGIKGNPEMGIGLHAIHGGTNPPLTLVMRGSTVTGNGYGIYLSSLLSSAATADLGTAASPGNNTIQNNAHGGLVIDARNAVCRVDAAGNTWRPGVQGASEQGKYKAALVTGPVAKIDANNFSIREGCSVQF